MGYEKHFVSAVAWFNKAVERESPDPLALYLHRVCLRDGIGVKTDSLPAMSFPRRAVDAELPSAHRALGDLYERGVGLPADFGLALAWYQKAVDKGEPPRMAFLADMYEHGERTAMDYAKAVLLLPERQLNSDGCNGIGWG
jgi:TPR repeat protein